MKVASIAHAILFIMLSMYYLFTSNAEIIKYALTNVFGEYYYSLIHVTLLETAMYYQSTIFALFFVESATILLTAFFSFMYLIKGMKYLLKKIQSKLVIKSNGQFVPTYIYNPAMGKYTNKQGTYLVLAQLRN